ncbi:MAG: HD domain-containing protein [Actinobacteria bacterium]|nr:MAG: HD domain-containing protein [Actinomycetota bacterium]
MGQLRPVRSEERTATVLSMPDEESLPILDEAGVRDQLLAFARDLNRIYHKERARAEELEHTLHELEESYFATVKTLAFVVEARDAHTRSHLSRAHDYAVALAQRVKPELADDRVFRYGFLLHDIGKVGIPDHILRKPSPLTREEWEVMQTHPILGGQMLGPIRFLQRAIPIVECHGEEIPLAARIFSVVDTFDAMTSDRPYRRALSVDEAVHEILAAGGTQLDPAIAEAFAALCRERSGAWPIAHGTTDVD